MLRVDPSLFSNIVTAVQRTGSLTGGAVRGLPNGVVIEGLNGINSFGSDIAEAQKEFELGRVHSALERVRQIETQFNGIAGRWDSTVGSVISSARQGNQQLPLQKLNEAKSAQTKMQQLTGPASKAFRDLISALEQAVSMEGHPPEDAEETAAAKGDSGQAAKEHEPSPMQTAAASQEETPDISSLGSYAANYQFGTKLSWKRNANKKTRIEPKLEKDRFYFLSGLNPPRVVRIREVQRQAVLVFDTDHSREVLIDARQLMELMSKGIWMLVTKSPSN